MEHVCCSLCGALLVAGATITRALHVSKHSFVINTSIFAVPWHKASLFSIRSEHLSRRCLCCRARYLLWHVQFTGPLHEQPTTQAFSGLAVWVELQTVQLQSSSWRSLLLWGYVAVWIALHE